MPPRSSRTRRGRRSSQVSDAPTRLRACHGRRSARPKATLGSRPNGPIRPLSRRRRKGRRSGGRRVAATSSVAPRTKGRRRRWALLHVPTGRSRVRAPVKMPAAAPAGRLPLKASGARTRTTCARRRRHAPAASGPRALSGPNARRSATPARRRPGSRKVRTATGSGSSTRTGMWSPRVERPPPSRRPRTRPSGRRSTRPTGHSTRWTSIRRRRAARGVAGPSPSTPSGAPPGRRQRRRRRPNRRRQPQVASAGLTPDRSSRSSTPPPAPTPAQARSRRSASAAPRLQTPSRSLSRSRSRSPSRTRARLPTTSWPRRRGTTTS